MKRLYTYKIEKQYDHIVTKFKEDEEYYATNLYDLCECYGINYQEVDLDSLEKDLEEGYSILVGDLRITKERR